MSNLSIRTASRYKRHRRLRKRVVGLGNRPRVCVFRSHQHIHVQMIDDVAGKTIFGCSTLDKRLKTLKDKGNVGAASELGKLIAQDATKKGIEHVVFDRGGYRYHGRVRALADALREGGLKF